MSDSALPLLPDQLRGLVRVLDLPLHHLQGGLRRRGEALHHQVSLYRKFNVELCFTTVMNRGVSGCLTAHSLFSFSGGSWKCPSRSSTVWMTAADSPSWRNSCGSKRTTRFVSENSLRIFFWFIRMRLPFFSLYFCFFVCPLSSSLSINLSLQLCCAMMNKRTLKTRKCFQFNLKPFKHQADVTQQAATHTDFHTARTAAGDRQARLCRVCAETNPSPRIHKRCSDEAAFFEPAVTNKTASNWWRVW